MPAKPVHTERSLYAWEIQEARRVFGSRIHYDPIRVHENTGWPNLPHRISLMLRRQPYKDALNAITLGNHLYFPTQLLSEPVAPDHPEFYKLGWLIHEITHAWQYQQMGWRYLAAAVSAQLRLGERAYDFGGMQGLLKSAQDGLHLGDFNLEQQADIARSYYERLARQGDVSAWLPFIKEVQESLA